MAELDADGLQKPWLLLGVDIVGLFGVCGANPGLEESRVPEPSVIDGRLVLGPPV